MLKQLKPYRFIGMRTLIACKLQQLYMPYRRLSSHAAPPEADEREFDDDFGQTSESRQPQRLDFNQSYEESMRNPEQFWAQQAELLTWEKKWDRVLNKNDRLNPEWFAGGQFNITDNMLDRHIRNNKKRASSPAIKYDSPMLNVKETLSFQELYDQVASLAQAFVKLGIKKGDCILIYMGMVPEAIVTMLACARIGAVHSLVFGGFPARTLATRIKHAQPKLIVTVNGALERDKELNYKRIVDEALSIAEFEPKHIIVYNRLQFPRASLQPRRDLDFLDIIDKFYSRPHDAVPIDANDPLYIIYTSGTTGEPKGIVRPAAGYAVALNWSMKAIYGLRPGETWWAASDLGWVVGHSYICYAPLLHGNSTVLFEGKPVGTPDASAYFRVLSEHGVASQFVAPTALRAIRKEDPDANFAKQYNLKRLRYLHVAGEHLDSETREWTLNKALGGLNVPVLDHWWQTETGWPITATACGYSTNSVNLNPPNGAAGRAVPGYDVRVVNDRMQQMPPGESGQIVVKLPLPPGCMTTLYKNHEKFVKTYFEKFPGYYDTMDSGFISKEGGYVHVMSRTDDVINVSGVRLSTAAIEEVLLHHPKVADCAVVGVKDQHRGQVPLACVVLRDNSSSADDALCEELVKLVREHVGAVANLRAKQICVVTRLPKTRSGKISRHSIAQMADNQQVKISPTIEDAEAYVELKQALQTIGYAKDAPDAVEAQ